MTDRLCEVCREPILGKRDRIYAMLPDQSQIVIMAHRISERGEHEGVAADVCMTCIADAVKNRKFTRAAK